jgi:hypothetical protein
MESIMFRIASLPAGLALFLVAACASTGEQRSVMGASVITEDEITASSASNVYELVQSLRPRWLNLRGQGSLRTTSTTSPSGEVSGAMTTIMVYVDGIRRGELRELESIPTRGVSTVRRLSAGEATTRFGPDHPHGAILVTTR